MIHILTVIKISFKLTITSLLSIIILVGVLSTGSAFALHTGSAADTIMNSLNKLFLDGGTDTYVREGLANRISFVAGDVEELIVANGFVRITEGFLELQDSNDKVVFITLRSDTITTQQQIGAFDFRGRDSVGNVHSYGKMVIYAGDPTDATEDGFYQFFVSDDANPNVEYFRLDGKNKDVDVFKTLDLNNQNINNVEDLDLTGSSATDDDTIFFDDGTTEFLRWDD